MQNQAVRNVENYTFKDTVSHQIWQQCCYFGTPHLCTFAKILIDKHTCAFDGFKLCWSLQTLGKRNTSRNNLGSFNVYWSLHHLDSWIKRDQPDVTCFIILLFNAQHVSDVNTSILRSLRLGMYCSGSMRVGVTLWFGWCGVVSVCRLQPTCFPETNSVAIFRVCWCSKPPNGVRETSENLHILTWLSAREYFIEFYRRGNFKT